MAPARTARDPLDEHEAYVLGLRWAGMRELSASQAKQRLERRGFDRELVGRVVARLITEGAIDDRRLALARARTEAVILHRGPARVRQAILALGIDATVADAAITEVCATTDIHGTLARALDRRLRASGGSLTDQRLRHKIFAALIRQGFAPEDVHAAVRARIKGRVDDEDD